MSRCKNCRYASRDYVSGDQTLMICNYILIAGVPRGCPPGDGCDKWEPWSYKLKRRKKDECE